MLLSRYWTTTAAAFLVLAMTILAVLTCMPGCGDADSGHRSGGARRVFFVSGVKVSIPGDYTGEEEALIREAVRYQLADWVARRPGRVAPVNLRQITVYDRSRGPQGPPLVEPRGQDHWSNQVSGLWPSGREAGVLARDGHAHLWRGSDFEVPLLYHCLGHFSWPVTPYGPYMPADYGHQDPAWQTVNGDAAVVLGVLRSQR